MVEVENKEPTIHDITFSFEARSAINDLVGQIHKTLKLTPTLSYRSKFQIKLAIKRKQFLMAFVSNSLVGWIEISKIYGNYFGLFSLFVDQEFRTIGIAKKLVNQAIRKYGSTYFVNLTDIKLINFFANLGFIPLKSSITAWKIKIAIIVKRGLSIRNLLKIVKLRTSAKIQTYVLWES